MEFKRKFEQELTRLNMTKQDVINQLGITRPTLMSRLEKPNTLLLGEIKQLRKLGFNEELFQGTC